MLSSLLAGIRGCTFKLALIYQSCIVKSADMSSGVMVQLASKINQNDLNPIFQNLLIMG